MNDLEDLSRDGEPKWEEADVELDAVGLLCPAPIIRTSEKMAEMGPGQVLLVLADDPGVEVDMPAWCRSTGHELLAMHRRGREYRILLRKRERRT